MRDADMQQSLVYGGKGTGVYFNPAVLPALQRSPKQKPVQMLGSAAACGSAGVPAATPAASPFSSHESHEDSDSRLGEPQGNLNRGRPLGLGTSNCPVREGIQEKLSMEDFRIRLTAAQLQQVQQTESRDSRLHKLRQNMEAVSSSFASTRTAAGFSISSSTGSDPSNAGQQQQPPALAQSISSRNSNRIAMMCASGSAAMEHNQHSAPEARQYTALQPACSQPMSLHQRYDPQIRSISTVSLSSSRSQQQVLPKSSTLEAPPPLTTSLMPGSHVPPTISMEMSCLAGSHVAGEGDASSAAAAAADNTSLMRIQNSPQLQRPQLRHQAGAGSTHTLRDCAHTSSTGSSLDIPGIGSGAATALLLCPEATAGGDAASGVSYGAQLRLEQPFLDTSGLNTLVVHSIDPAADAGVGAVPSGRLQSNAVPQQDVVMPAYSSSCSSAYISDVSGGPAMHPPAVVAAMGFNTSHDMNSLIAGLKCSISEDGGGATSKSAKLDVVSTSRGPPMRQLAAFNCPMPAVPCTTQDSQHRQALKLVDDRLAELLQLRQQLALAEAGEAELCRSDSINSGQSVIVLGPNGGCREVIVSSAPEGLIPAQQSFVLGDYSLLLRAPAAGGTGSPPFVPSGAESSGHHAEDTCSLRFGHHISNIPRPSLSSGSAPTAGYRDNSSTWNTLDSSFRVINNYDTLYGSSPAASAALATSCNSSFVVNSASSAAAGCLTEAPALLAATPQTSSLQGAVGPGLGSLIPINQAGHQKLIGHTSLDANFKCGSFPVASPTQHVSVEAVHSAALALALAPERAPVTQQHLQNKLQQLITIQQMQREIEDELQELLPCVR